MTLRLIDGDYTITQPASPIVHRGLALTETVYALSEPILEVSTGAAEYLRGAARQMMLGVLAADWQEAIACRADLEVALHDARRVGLIDSAACEAIWGQLREIKTLLHHMLSSENSLAVAA